MNQQTSPTVVGVPPAFLNRFGDSITGVLSGFDRLRLRGTLRHLFQPTVMEAYEKRDLYFLGFVQLAAMLDWLKNPF